MKNRNKNKDEKEEKKERSIQKQIDKGTKDNKKLKHKRWKDKKKLT
jgi:hypothetical protein